MDREWNPSRNVRIILKNIEKLLANPNFDDFIHPEPAFLFKEDRKEFFEKAKEWVKKFATEDVRSSVPEASAYPISSGAPFEPEKIPNNLEQVSLSETATAERAIWLWMTKSSGKNLWKWFWDIEVAILDNAYLNNEKRVELDHCTVDFDRGWKLDKIDGTQTPVIRSVNREHKAKVRAEWYAAQQSTESPAFYSDTYGDETAIITKCLSLDANISAVASGILCEGRLIGKPIEADYIAKELEQVANNDSSLVGLQCIHQYTRSSFLNNSLNSFLCSEDFNKVETLGPYLKLLFLHFKKYPINVDQMVVYRGINLSSEDILHYQQAIDKGIFRWFGFTSTSKSRKVAEFYDTNALMIIRLIKRYPNDGRAVNIAILSQFPEEQEVLLRAGAQFRVEKVELNEEQKKHLIHIEAYV
ncbi:unnamed protein product [Rotaria sp. Silwood2]|nr:unnamed protein product [Rotaria sp. Silwood2]CAF4631792.1 unnamed protein product [Rotaria sp. Silwood2]